MAVKQSGYLQRQAEKQQEAMLIGQQVAQQLCLDTVQITLYQDYGWTYEQILDFCRKWSDTYDSAWPSVMAPRDKKADERDVHRRDLDACLHEIVDGHGGFIPFSERYPKLGQVDYGRTP